MDQAFVLSLIDLIDTKVTYLEYGLLPATAIISDVDWHVDSKGRIRYVLLYMSDREVTLSTGRTLKYTGSVRLTVRHNNEIVINKQGKPNFLLANRYNIRQYAGVKAA